MPEVLGFDLYDEHWRDCWLAATSVARLRKKQIDVDIRKRIAKLLEDYGPQSDKPLTLRIYGTMIKGFCVINNERARSLFCDCERVVLMFSRRPFTESSDSTIKLPAAKRPRMEAALTLDLDLARVEASEAFDWTQAPLEEGALLRLGGGQLPREEALLPSLELGGLGDGLGPPGVGGTGFEAGWLPRFDGELGGALEAQPHAAHPTVAPVGELTAGEVGPSAPHGVDGGPAALDLAAASQLVPFERPSDLPQASGPPTVGVPAAAGHAPATEAPAGHAAATVAPAVQSKVDLAVRRPPRRRHEPHFKPGTVYGFDDETMLTAETYENWQQDDREIALPRWRPTGYAQQMGEVPEMAEHLGPWLRMLVDPAPDGAPQRPRHGGDGAGADAAPHPPQAEVLPEVQAIADRAAGGGGAAGTAAQAVAEGEQNQQPPARPPQTPAAEVAAAGGGAAAVDAGQALAVTPAAPDPGLPPPTAWAPEAAAGLAEATAVVAADPGAGAGGAEGQDDRTAEVGAIIRGCLQSSGASSAAFHELVPPGEADRPTAACTFSALLFLATAGEFGVSQESPYGAIMISLA